MIVKPKSWIKALNESYTAAIFICKNAIISTLLVYYHTAKARQTVDSIVKCVLLCIYLYTSIVQIFCKNLIKPYEKFTYSKNERFALHFFLCVSALTHFLNLTYLLIPQSLMPVVYILYLFINYFFFISCRGTLVKDYGTYWADIIAKIPATQ